ncbi:TetR/AcrR family transcriptional regulator [Bradyrhizobium mercantei]|uniref:TetR/AcrR family transcriptional regulator n=1 Tax=Bradyrhizobium mercantei TaxID=1904807 RepID=UPI000977FDC7|nr:TetR/AcrR family transcriptional regulator [Bradyrhizobium mercantei]
MAKRKVKKADTRSRQRMSAEDRKEQIVAAAIRLFSEHGFESSTHDLAKSLGVTQPAIYRHFPTKDDLVNAVYERVFLSEWRSSWDLILADRNVNIEDRLSAFYTEYTRRIFETDWSRIYLFSGLKRLQINRWYVALVEERVLGRIGAELRIAFGYPSAEEVPLTAEEIEALWLFHGGIFYYGVRDRVYGITPKVDSATAVELLARVVVGGMRTVLERIKFPAMAG